MRIRSLLVAVACTLPLTSFIVAGAHAEADEAAAPPQCPPFCPNQGKAKDRIHNPHHDGQPDFDKSHRKSHRFHKRSHSGGKVRLRFYPRYDPFYYDRFYNDPFYDDLYYDDHYYDWADVPDYSERLTCRQAIVVLRRHGYRNVKAYDCRGKSYGFYATRGGKKYKISVSSLDGDIISRQRIAR